MYVERAILQVLVDKMVHPNSGSNGDIERFFLAEHWEVTDMVCHFLCCCTHSFELISHYEGKREIFFKFKEGITFLIFFHHNDSAFELFVGFDGVLYFFIVFPWYPILCTESGFTDFLSGRSRRVPDTDHTVKSCSIGCADDSTDIIE